MGRRRRKTSHEHEAHAGAEEIWPAYVDVLSAAFVFILLAFFALMTRDVKEHEDKEKEQKTNVLAWTEYQAALSTWQRKAEQLIQDLPNWYLDHVQEEVLKDHPAAKELRKACSHVENGIFRADGLDHDRRHELTIVCKLTDALIFFKSKEWQPHYTPPELPQALVALANDLTSTACDVPAGAAKHPWCAAGIDVIGHTDCRHMDRSGNWELSTNRSGRVVKDMLAVDQPQPVKPSPGFRVIASGLEARSPEPGCACDEAGNAPPGCHDRNRRVEVRIRLRSTPIELPPVPPAQRSGQGVR